MLALNLCVLFLAANLSLSKGIPHRRSSDWGPFGEECKVDSSPFLREDEMEEVPWYTIDLDLPPAERWKDVAADLSEKIQSAIGLVLGLVRSLAGEDVVEAMMVLMKDTPDRLSQPYRDELWAMSNLTGIRIEYLAFLNIFYEIQKGCTSIVAENTAGEVYHARNLDFGAFFIWNSTLRDWQLTVALRELVINLEFVRGNEIIFKGVTFAGHLGVFTAVRPGAYSLSINTRFGSTFSNLFTFFTEGLMGKQFVVFASRDLMMRATSYQQALYYISEVKLLARGYFIIGGVDSNEGAVITKSYYATDHIEVIRTNETARWFVLQTNYDWDKNVIFLDDRRTPGNQCMQKLGQARLNITGLFQVLSSKPSLNKATVHTTVMHAKTGFLKTILQKCKDPCWFV